MCNSRWPPSYFERELDYKIKKLTTLIEPAVILFSGAIVGFVAVALVSAMYGIFRTAELYMSTGAEGTRPTGARP